MKVRKRMEQQQNRQGQGGQVPPMKPESYGKRLWHLWGPVVIWLVIGILVSMIAEYALTSVYIVSHYGNELNQGSSLSQTMELMEKDGASIMNAVVKQMNAYSTPINGVRALIVIPVMAFLFHKDRAKEKAMGFHPNKKAPIWKYFAVIVIAAAMCLGLNNLITIGNFSAASEAYTETLEGMYSAPLALQIAVLAIIVPISEELVFRGLLFKRFRESGGFMQAALLSAFVFGWIHNNIVQMIYGFVIGMMLAYLYEKYGSVKAPILAHMSMNLLSVLATKYKLLEWLAEDVLRIGIVTVACASIAATMFVFIQRIEEKPDIPGKSEEHENLAAV